MCDNGTIRINPLAMKSGDCLKDMNCGRMCWEFADRITILERSLRDMMDAVYGITLTGTNTEAILKCKAIYDKAMAEGAVK